MLSGGCRQAQLFDGSWVERVSSNPTLSVTDTNTPPLHGCLHS
jgi:hypothetical protein